MKESFYIAVLIVCILLSIENISAEGIVGISPGNIQFENVLRGGYAQRYITITIDSQDPILVKAESRGEIADWLSFPQNTTVSKSSPARFLVAVEPPTDVPNKNYTGFLRISTEPLGSGGPGGHAVSVIRAVLDAAITVQITDLEILQCSANSFKVSSAEKGDDVKFEVNILNEGNVRLKPEVTVDIWDQNQIELVKTQTFRSDEILPTKEESFDFYLPTNDLPLDQYWAEVKIPDCFSSDLLTFDVLEPGALKSEGILLRILGKGIASLDETIPLIANFKNVGEKDVDAQFKGQITKEGKIVQVLESLETTTPINEITNFTFFFTPKKTGRYIVSGRVFYDKKRTFELSTVVNVVPKKYGLKQAILTGTYLLIMILILWLFYKIKKEKKLYLEKIRKIKHGL